MRIISKYKLFPVILVSVLAPVAAVAGTAGGYPGTFLRIGVGAKAMSMGGAFVGMADAVSAVYWNPAGLVQLSGVHLTGMHTFMTLDRRYDFASFVLSYEKKQAIGISWLSYGVSNILGRDEFGNPTNGFSDSENGFILSYATCLGKITPKLSIGINLKYLYQNLASEIAHGMGFDAGIRIKLSDYVALGLIAQDIGSSLEWQESEHKDKIPLTLRSGASIKLFNLPATVAFDLEKSAKQTMRIHLGVEFNLPALLSLRAGYDNGLRFGAGFKLSKIIVDYAVDSGNQLGITHFVSLTVIL